MSHGTDVPDRRPRVALGGGGEFDLIRSFLDGGEPPGEGVRVGPGDDALVLDDGTVVSTDLSLEEIHFRREWLEPDEIGYRATVAALSDLAAMAAAPLGALVSVAVSDDDPERLAKALMDGVHEALRSAGGVLLGGDLSASPGPLVVDAVAVGRVEVPVLRDGARPGDRLWVTGRLGGAAGAVRAWKGGREPGRGLRIAFARPRARIREARWLARESDLHALIDLSDGLAGDAAHLAAAGDVGIVLDAAAVPIDPALLEEMEGEHGPALERALRGGEDYELLFSAPEGAVEPFVDEFTARFGLPLTAVGRVREEPGVHLLERGRSRSRPLEGGGFRHFAGHTAGDGRAAGERASR